jgi:hypothetical protein
MKNHHNTATGTPDSQTSLQELVNDLVIKSLSHAISNKSNVVNEIDKRIVLAATDPRVPFILEELISTVIANSRNGEIHITADLYSDVVTVQIQERNNYNGYALSFTVHSIEPEAIEAGGYISINGEQKRVTTISFSFPNQFAA